jgi:hypothetical protein
MLLNGECVREVAQVCIMLFNSIKQNFGIADYLIYGKQEI